MRNLTDQQLDDGWNAAIGAGDAATRDQCEAEFKRRQRMRHTKSPLVIDLERRLAERAGKPRSRPTARVDFGNQTQPGDDDHENAG